MPLTKQIKTILLFNVIYITLFGAFAVYRENWEFLFYVSIVGFFFFLLLKKHQTLGLTPGVLWGLSVWGLIHMMGGNIPVNGSVLYNVQLIPIFLKYDQLVHAFGFGVTTVVGWQLIRPYLKETYNRVTIGILIVMIGMGAGALNETLEFIATVIVPETNVGGYLNTSLDLIFNMLGASIAAVYIMSREKKRM